MDEESRDPAFGQRLEGGAWSVGRARSAASSFVELGEDRFGLLRYCVLYDSLDPFGERGAGALGTATVDDVQAVQYPFGQRRSKELDGAEVTAGNDEAGVDVIDDAAQGRGDQNGVVLPRVLGALLAATATSRQARTW